MPYVQRNASGLISAIFLESREHAEEFLPNDHPDIQNFFGGILPQSNRGKPAPFRVDPETGFICVDEAGEPTRCGNWIPDSDVALIRVIEDIIDALIDKNVIMFTDLPEAARAKILSRKNARERLHFPDLGGEGEDKIF